MFTSAMRTFPCVSRSTSAPCHGRQTVEGPAHCAAEQDDDLLKFRGRRVVRRCQQDGVAFDAVNVAGDGIAQQAERHGRFPHAGAQTQVSREWRLHVAVGHELNAHKKSSATDVADRLDVGQLTVERCPQSWTIRAHTLQ